MIRDHAFERRLLELTGAPETYVAQVLARLERVEAEHGNTGWEQPVDRLLEEIQEETADIVGWGIGVAYKLDPEQLRELIEAMRDGIEAWRKITALRESYR